MQVAKKKTAIPPERLRLYERLVKSIPEIAVRSNFGAAYTSVNGNMYTMISKHGVVGIRLPEPDRSAFLKKYGATIFRADPAWPPNPEYVAVPDELLASTAKLHPYLTTSYPYALMLKPKPTKRAARCAPRGR